MELLYDVDPDFHSFDAGDGSTATISQFLTSQKMALVIMESVRTTLADTLAGKQLDALFEVAVFYGEAARDPITGERIPAVCEGRAKNVVSVRFLFPNLNVERDPETVRRVAMQTLAKAVRRKEVRAGWSFLWQSLALSWDKRDSRGTIIETSEHMLLQHATTLSWSTNLYGCKDTTR